MILNNEQTTYCFKDSGKTFTEVMMNQNVTKRITDVKNKNKFSGTVLVKISL